MTPPNESPAALLHADLVQLGARWLKRNGCRVVLCDPFKAAVRTGECPDVIGWRDGHSILIECKTSRGDFHADKAKPFRIAPELGMGDARMILAPAGIIQPSELPEGWGLLVVANGRIRVEGNYPRSYEIGGRTYYDWQPLRHVGHKHSETVMLVSAFARNGASPAPAASDSRGSGVVEWYELVDPQKFASYLGLCCMNWGRGNSIRVVLGRAEQCRRPVHQDRVRRPCAASRCEWGAYG